MFGKQTTLPRTRIKPCDSKLPYFTHTRHEISFFLESFAQFVGYPCTYEFMIGGESVSTLGLRERFVATTTQPEQFILYYLRGAGVQGESKEIAWRKYYAPNDTLDRITIKIRSYVN